MIVRKWLTVNSKGSARLTQSKPSAAADEISIKLEVKLPNALFNKPRLEAKIEIPEDAVGPSVLDADVMENVKEAIAQSTGLDFAINIIKEEVPQV
jgi:hypothetical protein